MKIHLVGCGIGSGGPCDCGAVEVKSLLNRVRFTNLTWAEAKRKEKRDREPGGAGLMYGLNTVSR